MTKDYSKIKNFKFPTWKVDAIGVEMFETMPSQKLIWGILISTEDFCKLIDNEIRAMKIHDWNSSSFRMNIEKMFKDFKNRDLDTHSFHFFPEDGFVIKDRRALYKKFQGREKINYGQ